MSVIDDAAGATIAEISDELIFLIASASSPEQRKYAADLFRYFAKQIEIDAYRRGQRSMGIPRLPAPSEDVSETATGPVEAPAIQLSDDLSVSLIPPVSWHE